MLSRRGEFGWVEDDHVKATSLIAVPAQHLKDVTLNVRILISGQAVRRYVALRQGQGIGRSIEVGDRSCASVRCVNAECTAVRKGVQDLFAFCLSGELLLNP